MDINRIDAPDWARTPEVSFYDGFNLSDYEHIQQCRESLLDSVHTAVTEYICDDQLTFDDENFPSRAILTGDYYLSDEAYNMHVGPVVYHISVQSHFLGRQSPDSDPDDYLGLEVHLQWDPEKGTFSEYRNTDSSVI